MSSTSRAYPPRGTARGSVDSVKTAGSRNDAPYAAVDDRTINFLQIGRLLAGGEQLHRADDVVFFHRRPATGVRIGRRRHREVHDGGNALTDQDLCWRRGTDVGLHHLDPAGQQSRDLGRRRIAIDADDPLDPGVSGEPRRHGRTEIPSDAGDQDDARHLRGSGARFELPRRGVTVHNSPPLVAVCRTCPCRRFGSEPLLRPAQPGAPGRPSNSTPGRRAATAPTARCGPGPQQMRERIHSARAVDGTARYLPRRRRWTRVLRSSLRCFFLAIRLRRFLTTEPIRRPLNTPVGGGSDDAGPLAENAC